MSFQPSKTVHIAAARQAVKGGLHQQENFHMNMNSENNNKSIQLWTDPVLPKDPDLEQTIKLQTVKKVYLISTELARGVQIVGIN